jgi:hypothetical protein
VVLEGLKPRFSFANVISVVALFVALSAGAYAAFSLPKNSVKSKNIVNGQVKKADLAAKSVDGSKVKPNSLGGANIDESTLGQVPSALNATNATNATNAGNANTLGTLAPTAYGSVLTARVNNLANPLLTPAIQYGPISGIGTASNTPGAPSTLSPNRALVARDLSVQITAPPPMGDAVNVTLAVDGSIAGGFSCLFNDIVTTKCSSTDTFPIPAGSVIELAFVEDSSSGAIPSFDALVGLRLTPN